MFFVLTRNESPEQRAKRAFLEGRDDSRRGKGVGKKSGLRPEVLDDLILRRSKDPRREGDRVRYWEVLMAESSKIQLRKQMVRVALSEGVSEAARRFGTSRHTVRKWRDRYEAEGVRGLADRSRAPKRIPHKTSASTEARLLSLRDRYPGWGVGRLEVHFSLGCSATAAGRILRQAGRTRRRKKKRVRNDLRAEKARMPPFEKVQMDTKDLSDIPRYARHMRLNGLPRYEYTARDLRTGATWFSFADANNSFNAALFAGYVLGHLKRFGVAMNGITVQTDNGSEFIGHIDKASEKESLFEEVVRECTGRRPVQIFPGAKTSQSDVEAFHGLVETELYDVEDLSTESLLLGRARTYQAYFNRFRKILWKGAKTPAMILAEAGSKVNPRVLTLPPIRLETIPLGPLTRSQAGNDVPVLVNLGSFSP